VLVSALAIFSLQVPGFPDVPIENAALAALVPCLHESALARSARNFLCYNFLQPPGREDRILIASKDVAG
jgi:hypothetical protein